MAQGATNVTWNFSKKVPLKGKSALAASYGKLQLHSHDFSLVEVMSSGCWVVCDIPPVPSSPCELTTKINQLVS